MNNTTKGKLIESPLSAFNNLLLQISKKIEHIYFPKKIKVENINFINQLLFEQNSITILNSIKIIYIKNKIGFQFIGIFSENTNLIKISLENQTELFEIFQNYLFIINSITNNFDSDVSQKQVQSIFSQVNLKKICPNTMFIVPYKNKISHLYDERNNDKTLEKIFNRFTYVIKFNTNDKTTFKYKLCRVTSTILNESKSLENIRFEDIETLKEGSLNLYKLEQFLVDLFYYGEIK